MVATRANSASEVRTTTSFPSLLGMGDSVFNHYYFLVLLGNFKSFLIITDTKFPGVCSGSKTGAKYITMGSKPVAS